MVQDQLVEYVSSQLKLGISRDAIKSALTGVGWAPLDVEDTLKKVEGGAAPAGVQAAVAPKTAAPASGMGAVSSSPKIVSFSAGPSAAGSPSIGPTQVKGPEAQTVRVSDLVSSVAPASGSPSAASARPISLGTKETAVPAGAAAQPKAAMGGSFSGAAITAGAMGTKKKGVNWVEIIVVVLLVVFVGLSGYLFMQNSSMSSQLKAASGQSQSASQSSAAAMQTLNASNTALTAEVASATAMNQDLAMNLSFFVVPSGAATSATSVTVSGTLSAGLTKGTYMVTTPYGVKVYVKNSFDKNVAAALQPLLGTTVQIAGTYVPGTPNVTVTTVNGNPTTPPVAATTTTSTAPISTATTTGRTATTTP